MNSKTSGNPTLNQKKENVNPNLPPTAGRGVKRNLQPTGRVTRPVQNNTAVSRNPTRKPTSTTGLDNASIEVLMNTITDLSNAVSSLSVQLLQQNMHKENDLKTFQTIKESPSGQTSSINVTTDECATKSAQLRQISEKILEQMKIGEETQLKNKLELEGLQYKISTMQNQYDDLESALKTLRAENAEHRCEVELKSAKVDQLKGETQLTVQRMTKENQAAAEKLTENLNSIVADYNGKIQLAKTRLREDKILVSKRDDRIKELKEDIRKHQERIDLLEVRKREDEIHRRKLHANFQALKGNIRVIVRLRPPLASESRDRIAYNFDEQSPQDLKLEECDGNGNSTKSYPFKFDRIFGPESTQVELFDEIVHLVEDCVKGHYCSVLAYGQTGSGKSFTMQGKLNEPQNEGLILLSAAHILSDVEKLKEKGWIYTVNVSFLEINNDELHDLLSDDPGIDQTLEIKQDEKSRKTWVANITTVTLDHKENLVKLLHCISSKRSEQDREKSAQCHSVFQFNVVGKNTKTRENIEGFLSLVDLCGSEREPSSLGVVAGMAASTGNGDICKKDIVSLNSNLVCLSNVIAALASHEKNIPYRSSKLTHLLQSSLGRNTKMLMFANITPCQEDLKESLNTLRFAAKVNACEIGNGKKTKGKH